MYYDKRQYTLYHEDNPGVLINEPKEWKNDNKKFIRNLTYHGVTVNLIDAVTFVGDAKEYLLSILNNYGINANVRMVVKVRNPDTDIFEVDYIGYIDFMEFIESDWELKVKFNADPLTTLFKSKLSARVELETLESLSGKALAPLQTDTIYLEGRQLLLTNQLVNTNDNLKFLLWDDYDEAILAFELSELNDTDSGIQQVNPQIVLEEHIKGRPDINQGEAGENFYTRNDTGAPTTLKINSSIKNSNYLIVEDTVTNILFEIRIAIFTGGVNPVYDRKKVIYTFNDSPDAFPKRFDIKNSKEITLAVDESASIQYYIKYTGGGYLSYNIVNRASCPTEAEPDKVCNFINEDGEFEPAYYNIGFTVQEDSEREPSTSPILKIWDFANRLNDIVLEKDFKSDLLAESTRSRYTVDGELSDIGLLHGMWVRGMESGPDTYKSISTSWSDFLKSINVIYPIGADVFDDTMIIEARDYFYQKYVSIDLGEVTKFEKTSDAKNHFSLITVGYEKAGGYDEEQGLDEYNRQTQYSTILDKTTNELMLVAKYRADMYGLEDVRRDNPLIGVNVDLDRDSKFDDNIWMLDTNRVSGQTNIIVSDWDKRFAQAPTGVYSPDTARNIWLSPINIILRHGAYIKSPLLHYLDSWIRYTFSEGNSNLRTKLIGGSEYTQNVGIQVRDFERSSDIARLCTFEAPVTWEQLNGTTNGRRNVYGLVKFTFKGADYKGHIISVEQKNGIGTWKLKLFS